MSTAERDEGTREALRELIELWDKLKTEPENAFACAVHERVPTWRKLLVEK
jgi:hypothetical protein